MRATPEPRAQFIQLDVRELEIPQPTRMEHGTVFARTHHPSCDGRMPMSKHAHCSSDGESFRQRSEHFTHPLRWGFQAIERGMAAGAAGDTAGLTSERLDAFVPSFGAVAREAHGFGCR